MSDNGAQAYLDTRAEDPELAEMQARLEEAERRDRMAEMPVVKNNDGLVAGAVDEHMDEDHDEEEGDEHEGEEDGEHDEHEGEEDGEHDEHEGEEEGDGHFGHGAETLDARTPLWLQLWRAVNDPRRLIPNLAAGLYDAVDNFVGTTVDTAQVMAKPGYTFPQEESGAEEFDPERVKASVAARAKQDAGGFDQQPDDAFRKEVKGIFPDFMESMEHLREKIGEGSLSGDIMLQKTAQFGVPFAGALRLLNVAKGNVITKIGKIALADFAVNASVWDPHEARFGELLRAFEAQVPADSWWKPYTEKMVGLMGPYIDYISHTDNEEEWQGRWRNAVDSAVMNAVLAPVFFGAGVMLKAMRSGVRDATAESMEHWMRGARQEVGAPRMTIEIVSSNTPLGKRLDAAREAAGQIGDDVLDQQLVDAQITGMRAAWESRAFQRLAHAITGRHMELSGSMIPTKGQPFDFSGTFEGGLSPNIRLRVAGMTDDELKRMNAVIGDVWDQDAMVATETRVDGVKKGRAVEWGDPPREGYTRSTSLFIAEPEANARAVALKVRAAVPVEHEFSIRRVNEGFVIDVFPRFADDGPVGFDLNAAYKIADQLGDTVEAFPHDYRSIYTARDEYAGILEQVNAKTDLRRGGKEAGAGAEQLDVVAAARADLQRAREIFEAEAGKAIDALEGRVAAKRAEQAPHAVHPDEAQEATNRILARPGERRAVDDLSKRNREAIERGEFPGVIKRDKFGEPLHHPTTPDPATPPAGPQSRADALSGDAAHKAAEAEVRMRHRRGPKGKP